MGVTFLSAILVGGDVTVTLVCVIARVKVAGIVSWLICVGTGLVHPNVIHTNETNNQLMAFIILATETSNQGFFTQIQ